MAIGDLLWACPYCATVGAVAREGKGASACSRCGARFRRGARAEIVGEAPDGTPESGSAVDWLGRLPDIGEATTQAGPESAIRADAVEATIAGPDEAVRRAGEVLGFRETQGETLRGTLRLYPGELRLDCDPEGERSWACEVITGIQSSSRLVQIKPRGSPVVTFRFLTGSPRLWEELLQLALRRLYAERGWGEIREFQPRIVAL
ncbi:MAG: hypothetical protein ABFS34_03330 [Gemmatimonadota bacterium]